MDPDPSYAREHMVDEWRHAAPHDFYQAQNRPPPPPPPECADTAPPAYSRPARRPRAATAPHGLWVTNPGADAFIDEGDEGEDVDEDAAQRSVEARVTAAPRPRKPLPTPPVTRARGGSAQGRLDGGERDALVTPPLGPRRASAPAAALQDDHLIVPGPGGDEHSAGASSDSGYSTSSHSPSVVSSRVSSLFFRNPSSSPPTPIPPPTIPPAPLSPTKEKRLHVLTSRMTTIALVSPEWTGVAAMERLRGYTRHELRLQELVQDVARREHVFLADDTGAAVVTRLRAAAGPGGAPAIVPAARLDRFVDRVFGARLELHACHVRFLGAVQDMPPAAAARGGALARLLLAHAARLTRVYEEYGEELWQALRVVAEESGNNPAFRSFMQEHMPSSTSTYSDALKECMQKPLEQIKMYPVVLRLALKDTPDESAHIEDRRVLKEAIEVVDRLLVDAKLLAWQVTLGKDPRHQITWSDLVSDSHDISPMEVERQTAIFDLIRAEMQWVRTLGLFHTLFVAPLQSASPPILSPEKLNHFLVTVYTVQMRLYEQHFHLLKSLQSLQREQRPIIQRLVQPSGIAELDWIQTYETTYAAGIGDAVAWVQHEAADNPAFEDFLSTATFHAESPGQSIHEWLAGPSAYLPRCAARLRAVLDRTPAAHDDAARLPPLLVTLERVHAACAALSPHAAHHAALARTAALFAWSVRGADVDVDVENQARQLLFDGRMWLPAADGADDAREVHVFVLDNYLLITDVIERKGILRYDVNRRPIPLELLRVQPQPRHVHSSTLLYRTPSGARVVATPVTLARRDRADELTLLAASLPLAHEWAHRLAVALARRLDAVQERYELFQLKPVHPVSVDVTCSFAVPSEEAITLLARCAPQAGIWVLRPRTPPRMVLPVGDVTQMGVLDGVLVVLASKCITVYRLEDVLCDFPTTVSQAIHTAHEVVFFRIHQGEHHATLVVHKKHKDRNVFDIYRATSSGGGHRIKLSPKVHLLQRCGGFDFPVPCHDITFLKARAVLLTSEGFRFTSVDVADVKSDLKHVSGQALPFPDDPWKDLVQQCAAATPLAVLRTGGDAHASFLLCYSTLGVFVDAAGKLTGGAVAWLAGGARRVVACAPYVAVLGARLVEVRHAGSGRLVQAVPVRGGMRVTWDGRDGWTRKAGADAVRQLHVVSPVFDIVEGNDAEPNAYMLQELTCCPQSFILT